MKTLTSSSRKLLALIGMGLALVFLVACSGQTPSPIANASPNGNQSNPTGAPISNPGSPGNSSTSTERNGARLTPTYVSNNGRVTGIIVSGQGRATGAPDMATINLGVEATRDTVQAARDDAANAMNQVIDVLQEQGVAERDIQTRFFNINPRFDREGRTITEFQVSNQVTVKVRDLDNVSTIIDEVVAAGGNLTRFQGINFSIENTKPLEREARSAAVDDLRAKAQQLADLSGVQLGDLVSITETGGAMPLDVAVAERAFAESAGAPTPIMAGEMEVTITLQAVYAIGAAEPAQ